MNCGHVTFDELGPVTQRIFDYVRWRATRPLPLETFFRLQAADAARRLEAFEQQLQRRRMVAEHEAAVIARRLAKWQAVEDGSPYKHIVQSARVH